MKTEFPKFPQPILNPVTNFLEQKLCGSCADSSRKVLMLWSRIWSENSFSNEKTRCSSLRLNGELSRATWLPEDKAVVIKIVLITNCGDICRLSEWSFFTKQTLISSQTLIFSPKEPQILCRSWKVTLLKKTRMEIFLARAESPLDFHWKGHLKILIKYRHNREKFWVWIMPECKRY